MKNKKGFTLVELIMVIVLLTIVLLVAYPNFSKLTKIVESKYNDNIKIIAKNAAKIYVSNNKEEVDNYLKDNLKYCLPLAKLAAYEYLDTTLYDFSNNEINMNQCVNVTKEIKDDKIKYKYELSEDDFIDENVDYIPPILTLKTKETSSIQCKSVMNITKSLFYDNCEIVAVDNISTVMNITEEEIVDGNYIVLKYTVEDETGNKAIPIKIKLLAN